MSEYGTIYTIAFGGVLVIKTLIELFDSVQLENVIAGIRLKPEKIVFVGFKNMMTQPKKDALENFFRRRGQDIALEYEIVGRYDFDSIYEKLNYIIDNNEDCCLDLTGGKEMVLVAMGAVSESRNVPMFQFDVKTGDFVRIKNCERIADMPKNTMTLDETVELNGCMILNNEPGDIAWELADEFKSDLETMWSMCTENCGLWNRQTTVFDSFERFGKIDEGLCVKVNLSYMKEHGFDTTLNKRIINGLLEKRLLTDYSLDEGYLTFGYKNKQVHKCLTKAGNILELYAYMLFKEIAEETPGYYDDIDIGVYIDWDGVVHGEESEGVDTKNEVDIMLMRDLVPLFVSCKNGGVPKEALYELDTVSRRFGGKYAKRYVLATYLHVDSDARKYIIQRAKDMGITIIDGVHELTREEFKALLKSKIK